MNKIKRFKNTYKITLAKGFTLIEVLVASVILFTAVATVSMVYRGAYISSEKANNHVVISGMLPSLLTKIQVDIRSKGMFPETQIFGEGSSWGVDYQWQADLLEHKSAPTKLDPDSGSYVTPPQKYYLWLVNLSLHYKGMSKKYSFRELSWNDS